MSLADLGQIHWLNHNNYRSYNIVVARKLRDINAAIMLSEMVAMAQYFHQTNDLVDGEWFFWKMEDCEHRTMLGRKAQDHAINILMSCDLIKKRVSGLPAKRYFKVNIEEINRYFGISNNHSSLSKTDKVQRARRTECNVRDGQTPLYIDEPKDEPNVIHSTHTEEEYSVSEIENSTTPQADATERASPQDSRTAQQPKDSLPKPPVSTTRMDAKDYQTIKPNPKQDQITTLYGSTDSRVVKLTPAEYSELCQKFGQSQVDLKIEEINDYCAANGRKYKCYAATIRNWFREESKKSTGRGFRCSTTKDRTMRNPDGSPINAAYDRLF